MTFIPSSSSALSVNLEGSGLAEEDVAGAVTFEDLVAPVFLQCPPSVADRTFPVPAGKTFATVTLPEMAVYDTVDRSPVVEYPFVAANLSAIGTNARMYAVCLLC